MLAITHNLNVQTQPQIQIPKRQIDKNPFTLTHMSLSTRISPHYKLGKSRAHNWAQIFVSFPTKTNQRKFRYKHKTLDVEYQISFLYTFKSKHRNNTETKICTIESSILGFLRQLPRLWPC